MVYYLFIVATRPFKEVVLMSSVLVEQESSSLRKRVGVILSLAIPAMLEQILHTLVGFVDILFVSKLGTNAVAAVGVANAMVLIAMAIFMSLAVAGSSLITRSIGAGDIKAAAATAKQATFLTIGVGLVFGTVSLFFAEPILRIMGTEPAVLADAVTYFRIIAVPSVFIGLMIIFGGILRASGDTKTPMKVSLWINIIHIVLDYLLIFGIGSLSGLGIAGAAVATLIVRVIGSVLLFSAVRNSVLSFSLGGVSQFFRSYHTKAIVKLAAPVVAEKLIMRLGVILYYSAIIRIGTDTYAAHMIASNMEAVVILAGIGFEVASTVLVGQNLGAKRTKQAESYALTSMWLAILLMSACGAALYALAPWIASMFTKDANIAEMVVIALRFMAVYQPPLAVVLIATGALQVSGNTKTPMYSTAIGMWLVRLVGIYLFGIRMEMGITGVWLSIALDVFVRAGFLFWRFRKQFAVRQIPAKGVQEAL